MNKMQDEARQNVRKNIKQLLRYQGCTFTTTWDELPSRIQSSLASYATVCGYRKKYNPNCYLSNRAQLSFGFYYLLKNKVEG